MNSMLECICKRLGLNPWIEDCPRCGSSNPEFGRELTEEEAETKAGLDHYFEHESPQARLRELLADKEVCENPVVQKMLRVVSTLGLEI